MGDFIFKNYHRIAYWFRLRYWRGRNVHSPFMYSLVRNAIMQRRQRVKCANSELKDYLLEHKIREEYAEVACSISAQLNLTTYRYSVLYDPDVSLYIIPDDILPVDCLHLVEQIEKNLQSGKCRCVVLFGIYQNKFRHNLWKFMVREVDAVTVDLYHMGFVFFDPDLKKQHYKMKI